MQAASLIRDALVSVLEWERDRWMASMSGSVSGSLSATTEDEMTPSVYNSESDMDTMGSVSMSSVGGAGGGLRSPRTPRTPRTPRVPRAASTPRFGRQ